MLPSPLHPAVVHFPIVFMFLLPLAALGAWWAIRRGTAVRLAWTLPVVTALALAASALAAVKTGESDEDRAEDAVGERVLHAHEEAAERFLVLSGSVAVLMLAGFVRGRVGQTARTLGGVAALALIIAGYQVGHSGGQIVYGDGTGPGISGISTSQGEPGEGGRGNAEEE